MLLILGAALSSCSVGRAAMIGRTSMHRIFCSKHERILRYHVTAVSGMYGVRMVCNLEKQDL